MGGCRSSSKSLGRVTSKRIKKKKQKKKQKKQQGPRFTWDLAICNCCFHLRLKWYKMSSRYRDMNDILTRAKNFVKCWRRFAETHKKLLQPVSAMCKDCAQASPECVDDRTQDPPGMWRRRVMECTHVLFMCRRHCVSFTGPAHWRAWLFYIFLVALKFFFFSCPCVRVCRLCKKKWMNCAWFELWIVNVSPTFSNCAHQL